MCTPRASHQTIGRQLSDLAVTTRIGQMLDLLRDLGTIFPESITALLRKPLENPAENLGKPRTPTNEHIDP